MFTKVRAQGLKKQLTEVMSFIVQGTQGAAGRVTVPKTLADQILKEEPTLIKIQGEPDPTGSVIVYATSLGIQAVTGKAPEAAPAPGAVASTPSKFKLETGFVVPESKRGAFLKSETYPFASMQIGESFFVASTDEKPNPAKSLASTVSSTNKRYAKVYPATHKTKAGQPTGKDGRTFTVRSRTVEDAGETANGARVYRVA